MLRLLNNRFQNVYFNKSILSGIGGFRRYTTYKIKCGGDDVQLPHAISFNGVHHAIDPILQYVLTESPELRKKMCTGESKAYSFLELKNIINPNDINEGNTLHILNKYQNESESLIAKFECITKQIGVDHLRHEFIINEIKKLYFYNSFSNVHLYYLTHRYNLSGFDIFYSLVAKYNISESKGQIEREELKKIFDENCKYGEKYAYFDKFNGVSLHCAFPLRQGENFIFNLKKYDNKNGSAHNKIVNLVDSCYNKKLK